MATIDTKKLWKIVLAEIELSVSRATYKTHFAHTELLELTNNVAKIGIPNPLMRTMIETRYYSLIKSILDAHTKQNISMVFVISHNHKKHSTSTNGPLFEPDNSTSSTVPIQTLARTLRIRPEFTFETFAVSTSNQMAHAATTAVAQAPATAYNPLLLYGGVGVGKTHLMHSIANFILKKNPQFNIVSCMGEEFLNEIIEAIQTKTARKFKQKYRSAKLLLVDDVQFIAGKQTAQEEFFHTFNAVHREGGQIVLTSDRHPSEISRLEDRLRSRFEGGLIVDVSKPDFELRTAIVNIKTKAKHISLPPEASQLIAANITDTRAIEGFIKRLQTEIAANKNPLTLETISHLLGKPESSGILGHNGQSRRILPQDILSAVSSFYQIKPTALKGTKRSRPIAVPRQVVMYLCKTELNTTLKDIGGLLGGRDHTTIMHGVDKITKDVSLNEKLRNDITQIKQVLWK